MLNCEEVNMFRHILLPTDGSPLSEAAMRKGIQFAKTINARVTGFCVAPVLRYFGYDAEIGTEFKKLAEAAVQAEVNKSLLAIEKTAKEAGVPCETAQEKSDQPYEAIIEAAQKKECDLIIMSSHGRRGLQGLLLGSETQKVLTHSRIPVLVFR
jgi:nucleotide-binding universal stress UspA family protein